MIIKTICHDCKEELSIPEMEVFDGIVARPVDKRSLKYRKIWLCPQCREDAIRGGTISEEDVNIVN